MKKIFLDARFANRYDGTGRVSYNITKEILSTDTTHEYLVLVPSPNPFTGITAPNISYITAKTATQSAKRVLWDLCVLPLILIKNRITVYYAFEGFCIPILFFGKSILTIHDLIPITIPNYYQKFFNRSWFHLKVFLATKNAHPTIVVSKYTRKEVESFFPKLRGFIQIMYNSIDERFVSISPDTQILKQYHLKYNEYIFCIGGYEHRKNNIRILQGFKQFLRNYPESSLKLVIAGTDNAAYAKVMQNKEFSIPENLQDRVVFLAQLTDAQLKALYQHAWVFAFASLYEGFGIPILEAMAMKTPVIAMHKTSLPEAGGNAVYYIHNTTVSVSAALQALYTDQHIREKLTMRGEKQLAKFSWKTGAQTLISLFD